MTNKGMKGFVNTDVSKTEAFKPKNCHDNGIERCFLTLGDEVEPLFPKIDMMRALWSLCFLVDGLEFNEAAAASRQNRTCQPGRAAGVGQFGSVHPSVD